MNLDSNITRIENYLQDKLSQVDKLALEEEMQQNKVLKTLFDKHYLAYKILEMNEHLQLMEMMKRIADKEREKSNSTLTWFKKILNKLGLFQKNLEDVIQHHFTPYLAAVSLMGDTQTHETSPFIEGIKKYDLGVYSEAIEQLSIVKPIQIHYTEAQFYLGNAYLALQKPAMAVLCFEEILTQKQENSQDFRISAKWYQALSLLMLKEQQSALEILQWLATESPDPYYKNQAVKLLKEL